VTFGRGHEALNRPGERIEWLVDSTWSVGFELGQDCEIVKAIESYACLRRGLQFDTVPTRGRGRRLCLLCPLCGRRAFKLYRPIHLLEFACRVCPDQVWRVYQKAAKAAGIGSLGTHSLRHTYRTWLDSVGTPVGVQQRIMRHADVRTTMNTYGDAATDEMSEAHSKVVGLALNGAQTERRPS